ncbi:MAG: hypothetical protein AMXMBFR84_10590 [Candidatus Hydrogenedentota bacterium]
MHMDDTIQLNRWVKERDAEAFRMLVTRYAAMVFATGRRVAGNVPDAEDVAQECFQKLASVDRCPARYLGPWLHRVATNIALNKRRSAHRSRARDLRYAESSQAAHDPVWDDIYDYVDEALAELPEVLRVPLVAHFLEGQSQTAIANQFGLPVKTVNNRILKGIDETRKALARRGVTIGSAALATAMAANLAQAATLPAGVIAGLGKLALSGSGGTAAAGGWTLLGGSAVKAMAAVAVVATAAGFAIKTDRQSGPDSAAYAQATATPQPQASPPGQSGNTTDAEAESKRLGSVREVLKAYADHQSRIERIQFRYEAGTQENWQYPPNLPEARVNGPFSRGETGEVAYDGRRFYMHTVRWGGPPRFNYIEPRDPAHRIITYDGEQDIQYDGAQSKPGIGSIGRGAPIGETIRQAPSSGRYYGVWGMYLGGPKAMGFPLQEGRRMDEILSQANESRLYYSTYNGIDYAVVEADTPYGFFVVWFDPEHDYDVGRYTIQRREGHLDRKDRSQIRRRAEMTQDEVYNVSEFVMVDGQWVVKAFTHQLVMQNLDLNLTSVIDSSFTRTQITLNPDFDALGTFNLMRGVPDGSEWTYRKYPGYQLKGEDYFILQAGQLVPRAPR